MEKVSVSKLSLISKLKVNILYFILPRPVEWKG